MMLIKIVRILVVSILFIACSPSEDDLFQAGVDSMESGKYDEAIEYFDRVVELNDANASAYNAKGVAYFEKEEWSKAIGAFNQSILLDSTSYKPFFNRGNAHLEEQAYREAIIDYNLATRLDPNQPDIYYNRGLALLAMENYEDALLDFDAALRADPNQAQVHFNKAKALLGNNDPMGAISSLTDVVNLDKRHGAAFYLLGVTELSAMGKKEEGCANLKMALSLGYTAAKEWVDDFCKE